MSFTIKSVLSQLAGIGGALNGSILSPEIGLGHFFPHKLIISCQVHLGDGLFENGL